MDTWTSVKDRERDQSGAGATGGGETPVECLKLGSAGGWLLQGNQPLNLGLCTKAGKETRDRGQWRLRTVLQGSEPGDQVQPRKGLVTRLKG